MRTPRGALRITALLIFMALVPFDVHSAEVASPTWTQDMAKQLVALGWEDPAEPSAQPVVLYQLHFVELGEQVSRTYDYALQASNSTPSDEGWTISFDELGLRIVSSSDLYTQVESGPHTGSSALGSAHAVWLTTVANQPVRIATSDERIPENPEAVRSVSVTLTPERIDAEQQRILTRFTFDSTGPGALMSNADLTLWAAPEPQLIAVASSSDESRSHQKRRHVAIYLQASVISPEGLSDQRGLLPIGDVSAFEALFASRKRVALTPQTSMRLSVHHFDGSMGVDAAAMTRVGAKHQFTLALNHRGDQQPVSSIGLNHHIAEELYLTTRYESPSEKRPSGLFRLGLSETTQIGAVRVTAAALPLTLEAGHGFGTEDPRLTLNIHYFSGPWSLFYEGDYSDGWTSTVGTGWFTSSHEQGVELFWTFSPDGARGLGVRTVAATW